MTKMDETIMLWLQDSEKGDSRILRHFARNHLANFYSCVTHYEAAKCYKLVQYILAKVSSQEMLLLCGVFCNELLGSSNSGKSLFASPLVLHFLMFGARCFSGTTFAFKSLRRQSRIVDFMLQISLITIHRVRLIIER
jgi:hypothetical protein